jgi:hypothetical protein
MADPTGARQRTINSFFDSPRFPIKALPVIAEEQAPGLTATAPPPAPPPPAAGTPTTSSAAPSRPVLTLALPVASQRTVRRFLDEGLLFAVGADRDVSDIDVRLFEIVGKHLRPMGSAFRLEPPDPARLKVEATRFARSKLGSRGRRTFRVVARATSRDGAVGTTSATFRVT